MNDFEWTCGIEPSKDRKAHLWNTWRELTDNQKDWAGPCFTVWCGIMLTSTGFFDSFEDVIFTRKDVLDVLMADARGDIDANKPYPWEWKEETNNEMR